MKHVFPFRTLGVSSRPALGLAAPIVSFSLALSLAGCSDDTEVSRAQVVADYATLVEATYADTLVGAEALRDAVRAFTDKPSADRLAEARSAWLAARDPYGESEAFRFYEGPIDDEDDGPEGQINAWPIDEGYIDYVVDQQGQVVNGGIINSPDDYPEITSEVIAELNEVGGETNISTGYHAVEFLLWGQDLSEDGPGDRPFTDYVTGSDGTAENQDRRAAYLLEITDLLVGDLARVHEQWLDGEANFRADFRALDPSMAIGKLMLGMGFLAKGELSGERMSVAYDLRDQENEHSCFSDNTKADLWNNARAVQNVLLGRYADFDGVGIDELVEAEDPALARRLREQIQQALDDIEAIPEPFDQAILGEDDSEGRVQIDAAILSLKAFAESLAEAAGVLNIELAALE